MYPDSWSTYLISHNVIENEDQLGRRRLLMDMVRLLVPGLVNQIKKEYNLQKSTIQCQFIPFGSYGLGAHLASGDIDVAFLGPSTVRRRDFFRIFEELLKKQATVRDVLIIDQARVPIIKCTIDRIPVDICFVRLKMETVPADIDILDNKILTGLDEPCMGSLAGPRTLKFILKRIDKAHLQSFRTAAQSIKWWSVQRHLYDKQLGYLNSGALVLLLLKTYIIERTSGRSINVYSLVSAFFAQWSTWPWPAPVMLTDYIPNHDGSPIDYQSLVEFENAYMPIVTPCYRVTNAAPDVTKSTLRVLRREFTRGYNITRATFASEEAMIRKLLKPFDLVKNYTHFLKVMFSADTVATHEAWLRKIPDIFPRLVEFLEEVPQFRELQPYTKSYVKTIGYRNRLQKTAVQLGEFVEKTEKDRKKTSPLDPGSLHRISYIIGVDVTPGDPDDIVNNTIDISRQIALFRNVVDSKRNSKERDLVVNVVATKRKEIARFIKEHSM
ncbi:Poly(A) polymerase central domain-containing protein [Zychaea mexicana]|uniref:Poly(A) polymerase central domain-containing protein n=1 Tax=Zychaea mexicana TaxID=64656 RepID=UPI0022FE6C8F|nr:Poly(A) polymerase central domain-containing protein [Zychaea mexicana]KAI9489753.1 Poly(A) polymerase central domain-containing protein [Zychaea mexicana]